MSEELNNTQEQHQDNHEEHNFDGITELNNRAPAWIIIIFLITIGFSGIYAIRYFGHPDNKMDQTSEYERKVAAFEAKKKEMQLAAQGGKVLDMDEMIADGAKQYLEKGCIACHGMNGEGNNIGPNLSDNYWLNGCSEEEVILIITNGKPEKGMTPYKAMMSEAQIKNVSLYILNSLVGSNPENAKDAQGEVCNSDL